VKKARRFPCGVCPRSGGRNWF